MVITEKYYPYPVLGGKAVAFDDGCSFSATFKALSNSKKVVLEVTPSLKESTIESMIKAGDANLVCHIECPATAYRIVKPIINDELQKIEIAAGLVAKRVQANVVVVAGKHLPGYSCDSFIGLYKGRKFDVEQGSLLAVAETYSFDVEVRDSRISDAKSPIQICPDSDESSRHIHVDMDGDEIDVYIPQAQYKIYKAMDDGKSVSASGGQNHYLLIGLVVVPALVEVMSKFMSMPLDAGSRDVAQYADYKWYAPINAIVAEYLKGEGKDGDLSTIDFANHSPLKVAQFVADYPLVGAFKRLEEL